MTAEDVLALLVMLFVVFGAPTLFVFHVLRVIRRRSPKKGPRPESPNGAFPVIGDLVPVIPLSDDGPGRYRIVGVIASTGTDTKTFIEADSLANAKVKAELRGIVVTDIAKS